MNRPDDRLHPEERRIADLLGRPGRGEPSAAVDAAVLTAAHRAAAASRAPSAPAARRPRARVIGAFAAAASLCLAIGMAWQLRTTLEPEQHLPASADTAAAPATVPEPPTAFTSPPSAESTGQTASVQPRGTTSELAVPPATDRKDPAAVDEVQAEAAEPTAFDVAADAADESKRVQSGEAPPLPQASPERVATPTSDAAPPQPAELARPQSAARETANAEPAVASPAPPATVPAPSPPRPAMSMPAPAAKTVAPAPAAAPVRQSAPSTPAVAGRSRAAEDEEIVPPVTADDPAVRDAWLRNINDLLLAGHVEEARTSLRRFRERYPAHPLPEALRKLGD